MSELTQEQLSYIESKELEQSIKENSEKTEEPKKKKTPVVFKILTLIGFSLSIVGFVIALLGFLYSFLPSMQATFETLKILFITAIAVSFVAAIITGIGSRALKPLASLSFFFISIVFVASAAMLAIIIGFQKSVPLPALERLHSETKALFLK